MATHLMLQQAIQLMQAGKIEAGARMLNVIIKEPDLPSSFRATAYAWLAESQDDLNFKINCLNRALDSDPNNKQIQDRLNSLLAVQPANPNQAVQRPPAIKPNPATHLGNFPLPNPELPDSQPISVIKPDLNDSQRITPITPTPPNWQNKPNEQPVYRDNQTMPPANQPIDPMRGNNQFAPPQSPNMGRNTSTGSYPAINDPNRLTDSQPMYPVAPNNQAGMPQPMADPAQSRFRLPNTPRVIGVHQGANGSGTGVFVTTDGIVATTRYVVGGSERVVVELDTGQELPAQVIRTYPEYDLAFVQVNVSLDRVWPPLQVPVISDSENFAIVSFNGTILRGVKRKSKNQIANYWIQTSIDSTQISDAGGNAIFDNSNYLVGLLTRNASRETGLTYGIHILHIYDLVTQYLRDRQQFQNAGYCVDCGSLTRAHLYGGYYCETCGSVLTGIDESQIKFKSTPQLLQIYNENLSRSCPNCGCKTGYHEGKCLRCGHDVDTSSGRR